MKSTYLMFGLSAVVVGSIAAVFLLNRPSTSDLTDTQPSTEIAEDNAQKTASPTDQTTSPNAPATNTDAYITFSDQALAETSDSRRVLFFAANWCPTCKAAEASIQANLDQIPEDVTIIKVNYNDSETDATESELAEKYGVTYQHTFVQIDGQENELTKWSGGQLNELLSRIQ